MADTYTQFVVSVDSVSATGKAWAEQTHPALRFYPEKEAGDRSQTWTMQTNSHLSPDLDEVIDFARCTCKNTTRPGLSPLNGPTPATRCGQDGFGGSAAVVTITEVEYSTTHEWITQRLAVLSEKVAV
jgi:hypothetical protein